ncbi:MAG: peptidyl-prolyl cis-trans isomerase [Solirubrobacteraceae bacterium]
MTRPLRILLALGAFFVVAAGLAACGGVPGNSVARVDDANIKKSTFDHWLTVAAKSSQPPGGGGQVNVPDPPDYDKCIAAARKQLPKPVKGQAQPTPKQLKDQCKQQYVGLRDQVMQFLINAEWLKGEAADQDVKLSDAEITKSYNMQKSKQFPKPAEFNNFLKQSGMTVADLRLNIEITLLSNKLRQKITKGKDKVTPAQIAAYYNKKKQQFAKPETRDANIVLTKTKADGDKALKALKGGQSFKAVAKKFSTDPQTKETGGALPGITKGQQDPAFDKAVFAAKKDAVQGPIKTQFGLVVFEVTKTTPASQQTLAQATPQIRQQLASEGGQKALQAFIKKFEKKWKDRTDCRDDYVVQVCKNAKKPKTNTAPPGGAPQQGGGQQVPPQQGGGQQVPPEGGQQVPPQGGAPPPPQGGATPPPQPPPG